MDYGKLKNYVIHTYFDDYSESLRELVLGKPEQFVELIDDLGNGYMCKSEYSPILFFVKKSEISSYSRISVSID